MTTKSYKIKWGRVFDLLFILAVVLFLIWILISWGWVVVANESMGRISIPEWNAISMFIDFATKLHQ